MQRSMSREKFLRQHSQLPLRPRVWRRPSHAHISYTVQATLVQRPHTHNLRTNTSKCYQLSTSFDKGIFSEVLGNVALVPALPLTRYGALDKSPLSSPVTGWMSLLGSSWDGTVQSKGERREDLCWILTLGHALCWAWNIHYLGNKLAR